MNCDYRELITELLPLLADEKVLRRVWKILSRSYDMQIDRPRTAKSVEKVSLADTDK